MDVKTNTIIKAIRLLDAAGAQFKIIAATGEEYGTLKLAEPVGRARRHNVYAVTGYIPKVEAMKVGEVLVLEVPAGEAPGGFQSAICGRAGAVFGAGNYTTSRNGNNIEVLRIQ